MSTKEGGKVTVQIDREDAEWIAEGLDSGRNAAFWRAIDRVCESIEAALEAPPRSPGVSEGMLCAAVAALQALAPHEVKCRCGRGETFEGQVHLPECPRWQVWSMLDGFAKCRAALLEEAQPSPEPSELDKLVEIVTHPAEAFAALPEAERKRYEDARRSIVEARDAQPGGEVIGSAEEQSEAQPLEGEGEPKSDDWREYEERKVVISFEQGPLDGRMGFAPDTRPIQLAEGTYRFTEADPEDGAVYEWGPTYYPGDDAEGGKQ